jgi:hypothetical protein
MNYQPRFSRATGAAALDVTLDDCGRFDLERSGVVPHRKGMSEGRPRERSRIGAPVGEQPVNSADQLIAQFRATSDSVPTVEAAPKPQPPRRRVPDCDIVYVGPGLARMAADDPIEVRDLAFAPQQGTQGATKPDTIVGGWNLRRSLIALLAIEILVTGGMYLRQRYAESHVIVVPAATDERSVIT